MGKAEGERIRGIWYVGCCIGIEKFQDWAISRPETRVAHHRHIRICNKFDFSRFKNAMRAKVEMALVSLDVER